MGRGIKRSEEEKRDILRRVSEARLAGKTVSEALKEVGIYTSLYQQWRKRFEAEEAENATPITFTKIPKAEKRNYNRTKTNKKIAVIFCDTDSIYEVTRNLWQ